MPTKSSLKVLVVGDVLVDIICVLEELPGIGGEEHCTFSTLRVGGAAYNTAYALARLGVETYLYATVGDDVLGRLCVEEATKAGVNPEYTEACSDTTGYCISLVLKGGERIMITHRGASRHVRINGIPRISRRFDAVHVSGYIIDSLQKLEALRSVLAEIMKWKRRPIIFFDPGLTLHSKTGGSRWYGMLKGLIDHVMLNEDELRGTSLDPEGLFNSVKPESLVVKLGDRGAFLLWSGGEFKVKPPETLGIRDSVGAGDMFNAGYIASILSGSTPRDAVADAVSVAYSYLKGRI